MWLHVNQIILKHWCVLGLFLNWKAEKKDAVQHQQHDQCRSAISNACTHRPSTGPYWWHDTFNVSRLRCLFPLSDVETNRFPRDVPSEGTFLVGGGLQPVVWSGFSLKSSQAEWSYGSQLLFFVPMLLLWWRTDSKRASLSAKGELWVGRVLSRLRGDLICLSATGETLSRSPCWAGGLHHQQAGFS